MASLEYRTDLQNFNEMIASWPVQLALTLLYLGLAALVFKHAARAFDDPHRGSNASVLVLGVLEQERREGAAPAVTPDRP